MEFTHWLVVDTDGSVIAWFPKSEDQAKDRAERMSKDTGHSLTEGSMESGHWILDGPQGLKDLLRF